MNINYLIVFVSIIISIILTPLIKKVAFKINAVSIPKDDRRIHKKTMPLLGGLAIYLSFFISVIIKPGPLSFHETGILLGATIIAAYGVLDDIYEIKPWQKLLCQVAAACILIIFGVKISLITNPFSANDTFVKMGWISIPLTIIWIVGVTNALNLIDGLDGLAAGVACISSLTIFVVALINRSYEASFLTFVLSGAILGFLPYNFNPASIFMGEVGSALLGFLLASISIEGAVKSAAAFAIAVPILALGLPIYDTLFAIVRRKINGKPIMQADKGHLHHRLLAMGLTQKQAVITMYMISSVLGGIAILAMLLSNTSSYFLLTAVILLLMFIAWRYGFFRHKE